MAFDINDPEDKKLLDKAVKDALSGAIEEATEGLKNKNSELLAKIKKLQKNAEIDPEDHAALQRELEETQTALTKVQKDLKAVQKLADDSKKALEGETGFTQKLLIENGLKSALIENKVKPEYIKAVIAMLQPQATVKIDGEKRVAMIGDKELKDHVPEFLKSDEGKHFVSAANNQGGGSPGGGGNPPTNDELSKMSPEARLNAINEAGNTK
jgi:chromosome segregation ATPase